MKENILIIDDEVDICFILSGILRSKEYKSTYANTLREGLEKLNAIHPSVLFLDINLPDGNGLEYISKIKAIDPSIRIIMISAYDGVNERTKATSEGADGFIGKPFTKDSVCNLLDQLTAIPN
jgi:DNA-binding NtrC family response regulator